MSALHLLLEILTKCDTFPYHINKKVQECKYDEVGREKINMIFFHEMTDLSYQKLLSYILEQ